MGKNIPGIEPQQLGTTGEVPMSFDLLSNCITDEGAVGNSKGELYPGLISQGIEVPVNCKGWMTAGICNEWWPWKILLFSLDNRRVFYTGLWGQDIDLFRSIIYKEIKN